MNFINIITIFWVKSLIFIVLFVRFYIWLSFKIHDSQYFII